jgi:hypothetical protein
MMTFDEFCSLPVNEMTKYTPDSMIFAAGGTRRAAVLAGIQDQDAYVRWSSEQLMTCFGLFAQYGVRHIVTHAIVPTQWMEITPGYREKLVEWVQENLTNEAIINTYQHKNWRSCLIGVDFIPEFKSTATKLLDTFPKSDYSLTVYYAVTPAYDSHWLGLMSVLGQDWQTQEELILAQYKEPIPPIKLYVGYGKPVMSAAVCPPSLGAFDGMHSYWLQKPGFVTDERSILSILYDYSFTRQTWMSDKSERTTQVLNYRTEISQDTVLGVGKRLGPFWYPDYASGGDG